MLKICHIVSGDLWYGAEAILYTLLKCLKRYDDIKLSVITLNEGRLADAIRTLDISVNVVNEKGWSFFQNFRAIKKIVAATFPDIIHTHRYKENILAYSVSRGMNKIKLVCTQHALPPELYIGNVNLKSAFINKLNFILMSNHFDCTVAVSNHIQYMLVQKYGFSSDRIKMIHNGIEVPERKPYGAKHNGFTIGASVRFFPIKNIPFMIEVANEVTKKTKRIFFKLAGEGPEKENIRLLIQRYSLEEVIQLCGFIDNISAFYQDLDLYLNTALHEGISLSILEAMCYDLPVIASNIGGTDEIIENGVTGYLINGWDPKIFAQRCLELYENSELRLKMGLCGRLKIINEFSSDKMAKQYYDLYINVLKDK